MTLTINDMEAVMKNKVDPDLCTGCELCCGDHPELYEMKGDVAVAISENVSADMEEAARDAADNCPAGAISVE
jgi:ferredoxin